MVLSQLRDQDIQTKGLHRLENNLSPFSQFNKYKEYPGYIFSLPSKTFYRAQLFLINTANIYSPQLFVKQSMSLLLDPPTPNNNDWRQLAERLGVNRYMTFFATQPSPTEAILNLWEARNRESTAVAGLVNTLSRMGRHDAAQILQAGLNFNI